MRIDVQPDVLAVAGERGQGEPLPVEPLGQVRGEQLLRRLDPLPRLRLPDLRTQSCGSLPPRQEAALEDDVFPPVVARHRVLDEESRPGLRRVLTDPSLTCL